MTTPVFSLAPSPKWYFLDAQGRPAAGGTLTTWSSTDHSTPKFVYSDPAGAFPYLDPIILDATGGTPVPIYWDVSNTPTDPLYYIVVKDAAGNIIFDLDNFPISGGGGVSPITTNIDIENHIINGQFIFIDANNEADSAVSPAPIGSTHMAPGSGYFKTGVGGYVQSIDSAHLSGWSFVKAGGAGATDTIQFLPVINIGEGFPNSPSANAVRYFQYKLSGIGTVITDASFVYTIPNVETFQNETLTIYFETLSNINGVQGAFEITQYFGTGGSPSAPVTTSQSFTFSNPGWAANSFSFSVPSIIGKNKGTNGDDAIFIRWQMPLNTIGEFNLDNMQIQRGTFVSPTYIEQTYSQDQYKVIVDLIVQGNLIFPTGELKWMSVADIGGNPIDIPGWIPIADITAFLIGSTGSGSTFEGPLVKNLYIAWWNSFSDSECPVNGGRGASALDDFNDQKGIKAPQHIVNSVLAGAGQGLTVNPPFGFFEGTRGFPLQDVSPGAGFSTIDVPGNTNNIMQPTFYLWLYVKL